MQEFDQLIHGTKLSRAAVRKKRGVRETVNMGRERNTMQQIGKYLCQFSRL
jgi:hypothetical protein